MLHFDYWEEALDWVLEEFRPVYRVIGYQERKHGQVEWLRLDVDHIWDVEKQREKVREFIWFTCPGQVGEIQVLF
jgi:hypothetical protein